MPRKPDKDALIQIEATQAALRDCIEQARELAAESERLVRKHRRAVAAPESEPAPEPKPVPPAA